MGQSWKSCPHFSSIFTVFVDLPRRNMCRRRNRGMVAKLATVSLVVVFCLFFECAAGACLSYGASCLGAHGKRSENRNTPLARTQNARIFLSKLLDGDYQFLSEPQIEGDDLKNLQAILSDDENFSPDEFYKRLRALRPPVYLEKRSTKLT